MRLAFRLPGSAGPLLRVRRRREAEVVPSGRWRCRRLNGVVAPPSEDLRRIGREPHPSTGRPRGRAVVASGASSTFHGRSYGSATSQGSPSSHMIRALDSPALHTACEWLLSPTSTPPRRRALQRHDRREGQRSAAGWRSSGSFARSVMATGWSSRSDRTSGPMTRPSRRSPNWDCARSVAVACSTEPVRRRGAKLSTFSIWSRFGRLPCIPRRRGARTRRRPE